MAYPQSTTADRSETVENVRSIDIGSAPTSSSIAPSTVVENTTKESSPNKSRTSNPTPSNNTEPHTEDGQRPTSRLGAERFSTITTIIPTGDLTDPFQSEVQFSNRGSILIAGTEANDFDRLIVPRSTTPPTVDQTLSRRVRSFYELENEAVVEQEKIPSSMKVSKHEEADGIPDLTETHSIQYAEADENFKEPRDVSALITPGHEHKEYDAAGGIEDWTNVNSRDVDRWGFIERSQKSSVVSPPGSLNPGTALDAIEEYCPERQTGNAKRKTKRLSLNPGGKTLRSSPSLLSSRSKRSTASRIAPYRKLNGGPRWLIDAGDMLISSPGLGNQSSNPHLDPAREAKRADKWQKMARPISDSLSAKGAGTKYLFNTSDPKLISRVWKGIPDRWRSEAWYAFLTTSAARRSSEKNPQPTDEELKRFFHICQEDDCSDDVQIDMDVPRTIGNHLQFRKRYRGGQRFLFRVLRALSLYFPATGYVQGMASVVATLLVYYEESRAFVMAVRLWKLRGIESLYAEGFGGLMDALRELEERWIKDTEVLKQLEGLGISTSAWGPKWYLTIFNYVLPFHTTLRVWDVFMLMGDPQTDRGVVSDTQRDDQANFDPLHAASAAMLFGLRDTIVGADFENAMKALTSPVGVAKDDKMMSIARKLWEEKTRER